MDEVFVRQMVEQEWLALDQMLMQFHQQHAMFIRHV